MLMDVPQMHAGYTHSALTKPSSSAAPTATS
jgi:hypothetical protein